MPTVRKAVFPVAGMGTRFLPATKVIPKEMLNLVDKPIIQYGVEEAVDAGCNEIIFVTSRGKTAMEDHFDISYELEDTLEARGKKELHGMAQSISRMVQVMSVRQKQPLGLGHAVLMAKKLVDNDPFAVLLPDDVVDSEVPCIQQLINVFEEKHASVIATQVVEGKAISAYGVLDAKPVDGFNGRLFEIRDMVEKPKPDQAPSNQAIIGRYVLTPRIFDCIERITPGAGGELQLTDAMRLLLKEEKMYGYCFSGKRHDAGDKFGYLKATVEFALKHEELGPAFQEFLKSLDAEAAAKSKY